MWPSFCLKSAPVDVPGFDMEPNWSNRCDNFQLKRSMVKGQEDGRTMSALGRLRIMFYMLHARRSTVLL